MLEFADRFFDIALRLAHAARHPVVGPQFVEHRSLDALAGIGFELRAVALLEAAGGVHQADHAGLDQVVGLHRGRQAREQMVGHALDQGDELLDFLIAFKNAGSRIHVLEDSCDGQAWD